MVYAPRQCWQNLLDPEAALANGTLFGDLILPFEGGQKFKGTEGHSVR
ncbi:MAG: spore coat associated protein CotJA [Ruminococcaceae bacterium]|nr:spore coat associated protein CotJA [Oscillospiraceae bacterium]